MALYDRIGAGYDDTRQADPYLRSRLIHHLRPSPTGRYLDVGSGTGNYTLAMHQADVEIYGLEVSPIMLEAAKRKSTAIAWVNARAEVIPPPGTGAKITVPYPGSLAVGESPASDR